MVPEVGNNFYNVFYYDTCKPVWLNIPIATEGI